jgi:hypothetical protein
MGKIESTVKIEFEVEMVVQALILCFELCFETIHLSTAAEQ